VLHFDHLAQGAVVARRELVEHVLVGRAGRVPDDRLQVLGQFAAIGLRVDDELEHGTRLVPARVVVVLGNLVQTQRQVVVGTDPLHGIDDPGLQCRVDLATGNAHRLTAGGAEHLTGQARNAHAQAAQVGQERISRLNQPAICTPVLPPAKGTMPAGA
jgi:hypothetical protein